MLVPLIAACVLVHEKKEKETAWLFSDDLRFFTQVFDFSVAQHLMSPIYCSKAESSDYFLKRDAMQNLSLLYDESETYSWLRGLL